MLQKFHPDIRYQTLKFGVISKFYLIELGIWLFLEFYPKLGFFQLFAQIQNIIGTSKFQPMGLFIQIQTKGNPKFIDFTMLQTKLLFNGSIRNQKFPQFRLNSRYYGALKKIYTNYKAILTENFFSSNLRN